MKIKSYCGFYGSLFKMSDTPDKGMFMLNYIFNVDSIEKGPDLVDEAHEAWLQFIWYCDPEEREDDRLN